MTLAERTSQALMGGFFLGAVLWAFTGSFWNMYAGKDIDLLGNTGGRGTSEAYVDIPY